MYEPRLIHAFPKDVMDEAWLISTNDGWLTAREWLLTLVDDVLCKEAVDELESVARGICARINIDRDDDGYGRISPLKASTSDRTGEPCHATTEAAQ
jgi:hypothetical protein